MKYALAFLGLLVLLVLILVGFSNFTAANMVLGTVVCVLLICGAYLAFQPGNKPNSSQSDKEKKDDEDGTSRQSPEPARAPAATPPIKSSGSKLGGQAPYWAIALVFVVVLILLIAKFAPVVGDGILEVGFGDRIIRQQSGVTAVQPASAELSEAERHANAVAERNRIESEPHDPILRYGVREEWIRVPDGGFVTILQHVEHNRVVGVQCSSSVDKPPADATGEQYNCVSGVVARWVRYSYWGDDAGPVRIHYRFHYAF